MHSHVLHTHVLHPRRACEYQRRSRPRTLCSDEKAIARVYCTARPLLNASLPPSCTHHTARPRRPWQVLNKLMAKAKLQPKEKRALHWHLANLEYGCATALDNVSLSWWAPAALAAASCLPHPRPPPPPPPYPTPEPVTNRHTNPSSRLSHQPPHITSSRLWIGAAQQRCVEPGASARDADSDADAWRRVTLAGGTKTTRSASRATTWSSPTATRG